MPLDPQAEAFLERLRAHGGPPYYELTVAEARRAADERTAAALGEPENVREVEDAEAGGVPVRIYRDGGDTHACLVYFHGGGWVLGGLHSHDVLCRSLAVRTGVTVVAVDYRLAPEHPHPAALEDAWAVTRWAAERHDFVAVAGDSAGGHLAAVVALRAREMGLRLALQALVYPVTDYSFDTPSYRAYGTGTNLTAETMRWFWASYVPDASLAGDPEVSPLRAPDLSGVAPAFVLTAEYDPLCDEGEAYARRLEEAGVPVTLSRYDGQIHSFVRFPAVIDRAHEGVEELAAAVRAALV